MRCIIYQDNAPAHKALSVKKFLANKNITVLEQPPYSPDLAPCNVWLFPKIKPVLKGTHFVSVENVKAKRRRSSTAFQNMTCGIALNIASTVCSCVSLQKGAILKVIVVDFLNLLNRKNYRHSPVFWGAGPRMLQYPSLVHHYIKTCLMSTQYKRILILFCFFRVWTDRRTFGTVSHRFTYKFGNVHSASSIKSSRKPQNVRKCTAHTIRGPII